MKQQVGKITMVVIIVIAVGILGWYGMRTVGSSESGATNEEAVFRAAEKRARENGVDLRTMPEWADRYYKYHPEEKRPISSASGTAAPAPSTGLPPPPPNQ
jgi:hypothetical protein